MEGKELIKFVKAVPGDNFHVDEVNRLLLINGEYMVNTDDKLYKLTKQNIKMLKLYEKHMPILIQEFIKTDYDVRVVILDGKVLGSMKREVISDPQDFRTNVSLGAESSSIELTEIEKKDSIKAAEVVGGRLVGVDFIPSKDRKKERPYILEVNSMPGFGGIEKLNTKKSLTQDIFKHFLNRDNWT